MIKNLSPKMAVLVLALMMVFGGVAKADPIQLRLVIDDTSTAGEDFSTIEIVDSSFGFVTPGPIEVGQFYITFAVGLTEGTGSANRLALLAHIDYRDLTSNPLPAGQLRVILEGSGYVLPSSIVTFRGSVGGFDMNALAETPAGQITNGSGTFQTSLNGVGAFGPSGYTASGGAIAFGPTGGWLEPDQPFLVVSEATLDFNGGGQGTADFSLVGEVSVGQDGDPLEATSVPEPTSLLLLGSGLASLGLLRFRKRTSKKA